MVRVYTVGHSNRSLQELVDVLVAGSIRALVDVRAHPGSRHNPQFKKETLRAALTDAGIDYHWAGQRLGGMRKAGADSPHRALPPAMRGYAEHMQSEAFADALRHLRRLAGELPAAIMCAERDPAQCHRSLIADALLQTGDEVWHLISATERHQHQLHPAARTSEGGLVYDGLTQGSLDF